MTMMSSMMMPSTTSSISQPTTQQAKEDRQLVQWVQDEYQRMKSARLKLQLIWYVNMAFYYGNQYVEMLPRLNKLGVPRVPPYRVRLVSNRIRPIIRKEIARLTSQKPTAFVVPSSSDDEDLFAAYAGEAIWESIFLNYGIENKFRRSMWWMCITGTSFMKTWWDPNKKDPSGNQGDFQYAPVTPFHLFVPDLREQDIQDQPYILNVYTKPVEWVKHFYQINAKPDAVAANEIISDAYLQLNSGTGTSPDSVLCMELWAKPGAHRLLPDGGVIHIIGDQIIAKGGMYQHGLYPFTKFEHIPTGKFYAESVITDLISLQKEYNRTRSQITEAKNRMAKPGFFAVEGSVDPNKWTTEPGTIVESKPGMPMPTPIPLVPLPNYVINELDRHITDMEDISGQHEVSKGSAPPGVTAATAISYLQEQDDSLLSHTYSSIEEGFQDIAKQTLQLATQFWDMQRAVKTTGSDGTFDTLMLSGADIKNGTDIHMEGGSSLPTSRAARQSFLMDLMKMQFISPDDGLKLMDMGGVTKIWQRLRIDQSQAQRENVKLKSTDPQLIQNALDQKQQIEQAMQTGQPLPPGVPTDPQTGQPLMPPTVLPVNNWDNHGVHVETHNNFRKTQAFEMLPEPIKQAFEEHVNMHLAAITAAMQQVQDVTGQSPVSGPPGPQGGNSPQLNEMGAPNGGSGPPSQPGPNG